MHPLDVRCYRAVKKYVRNFVDDRFQTLRQSTRDPRLQVEDLVKGMNFGFEKGVTESKIRIGFSNSGCYPLNVGNFEFTSVRKSLLDSSGIWKSRVIEMTNSKKDSMEKNFKNVEPKNGYISSKCGVLLSSEEAISLI